MAVRVQRSGRDSSEVLPLVDAMKKYSQYDLLQDLLEQQGSALRDGTRAPASSSAQKQDGSNGASAIDGKDDEGDDGASIQPPSAGSQVPAPTPASDIDAARRKELAERTRSSSKRKREDRENASCIKRTKHADSSAPTQNDVVQVQDEETSASGLPSLPTPNLQAHEENEKKRAAATKKATSKQQPTEDQDLEDQFINDVTKNQAAEAKPKKPPGNKPKKNPGKRK